MNVQRFSALLAVCLALAAHAAAAESSKLSLLLVEFGKDESSGAQTQSLVRYRFEDGVLSGRQPILTTRTSDVRFDLGQSKIHRNRYVVTRWGDVIDAQTGELLFESPGELVWIDDSTNSVIIRVNKVDRREVGIFDFESRQYRTLENSGLWNTEGKRSPNGQSVAGSAGDELWIERPGRPKVVLANRFSVQIGSRRCSDFPEAPFIWIDDSRLLTQKRNGELVVVTVEGAVEDLFTISEVSTVGCGPKLGQDEKGQIYYQSGSQYWLIDVAARKYSEYRWRASGNGFEISPERHDDYGHLIRFQAQEIGKLWSNAWEARTAPGHIALDYGPVGSNLGYPKGVKVWSEVTREWTTLTPEWLTTIIGWVSD